MQSILQRIKKNSYVLVKLLPILSFMVPFLILYLYQDIAYPPYPFYYRSYTNTFEMMWKGRTFYIFFLWLTSLEIILSWDKLKLSQINKVISSRTIAFIIALLLPTIYVVLFNYCGLNVALVDWAWQNGIVQCDWMPLSIEYLVFAALYTALIFLQYGVYGLKSISLSPVFLAAIGIIYTIDNTYQYGSFTPFQILVPTTANLAAYLLNLMGYQTQWLGQHYGTPVLSAWNTQGSARFGIAWPCSGIESLLIYTLTILLFLRNTNISWKQRALYFLVGAIVTFFINVMRIATIFIIAIDTGMYSLQTGRFHDYYGQLYSITWIALYPLMIIATQALWRRINIPKDDTPNNTKSFETAH